MRKVLAFVSCLLLTISQAANADSNKVILSSGGVTYMSFTVPTSVTIPANGCATLNIPYRMNKKFSSPIVYAYVALVSKKNSFATSEYILPSLSTTEAGTNPHVSTEKLRLCSVSEPYINDYGDKVTPVAVKTGTYSLTVSYTKMKPKFLSIKSKTYLVNVTVK